MQGDISAILDLDGNEVVCYTYDAWGNCSVEGDVTLGELNPFRYRSYFYDNETKLYFLQTRYYDPEIGRFISQDDVSYLDPEHINGLNLYAYCGNNPVMGYDPDGTWDLRKFFQILGSIVLVATAVAFTAALAIVTGGLAGVALMAVATGMAFGALGGGVSAAVNGTNIAAGILGGAVKGAATGLAVGLGIATGAGALSLGVGLLAFGASIVVNMTAGMINYAIDNGLNGRKMNWGDAFASGGLQALSGAFAFVAGTIIGASGFYNVPGKDKMFTAKWCGNVAFGQFAKFISFYPFDYSFKYFQKQYFSGR